MQRCIRAEALEDFDADLMVPGLVAALPPGGIAELTYALIELPEDDGSCLWAQGNRQGDSAVILDGIEKRADLGGLCRLGPELLGPDEPCDVGRPHGLASRNPRRRMPLAILAKTSGVIESLWKRWSWIFRPICFSKGASSFNPTSSYSWGAAVSMAISMSDAELSWPMRKLPNSTMALG